MNLGKDMRPKKYTPQIPDNSNAIYNPVAFIDGGNGEFTGIIVTKRAKAGEPFDEEKFLGITESHTVLSGQEMYDIVIKGKVFGVNHHDGSYGSFSEKIYHAKYKDWSNYALLRRVPERYVEFARNTDAGVLGIPIHYNDKNILSMLVYGRNVPSYCEYLNSIDDLCGVEISCGTDMALINNISAEILESVINPWKFKMLYNYDTFADYLIEVQYKNIQTPDMPEDPEKQLPASDKATEDLYYKLKSITNKSLSALTETNGNDPLRPKKYTPDNPDNRNAVYNPIAFIRDEDDSITGIIVTSRKEASTFVEADWLGLGSDHTILEGDSMKKAVLQGKVFGVAYHEDSYCSFTEHIYRAPFKDWSKYMLLRSVRKQHFDLVKDSDRTILAMPFAFNADNELSLLVYGPAVKRYCEYLQDVEQVYRSFGKDVPEDGKLGNVEILYEGHDMALIKNISPKEMNKVLMPRLVEDDPNVYLLFRPEYYEDYLVEKMYMGALHPVDDPEDPDFKGLASDKALDALRKQMIEVNYHTLVITKGKECADGMSYTPNIAAYMKKFNMDGPSFKEDAERLMKLYGVNSYKELETRIGELV